MSAWNPPTHNGLFAEVAHEPGLPVFPLHPKDTHHDANAVGLSAKTDRDDAEVITRMIAQQA